MVNEGEQYVPEASGKKAGLVVLFFLLVALVSSALTFTIKYRRRIRRLCKRRFSASQPSTPTDFTLSQSGSAPYLGNHCSYEG